MELVGNLLHNVPGVVVSVVFPSAAIQQYHDSNMVVHINFKSTLKSLVKQEPPVQTPLQLQTSDGEKSQIRQTTNRYNNIIDKLVRKYTQNQVLHSDDSDNPAREDILDSTSSSDSDGDRPSRKRPKVAQEDYDLDDPFIDDSEHLEELEICMKRKHSKTKQDGFFVSSGKLEVVKVAKSFGSSRPQEKREQAKVPKSMKSIHLPRSSHEKPEKPRWIAYSEVLDALEALRVVFVESKAKLCKSSNIPKTLEEPLFKFHKFTLQYFTKEALQRTSGYLESIQHAFGGEVLVGRIRSVINRLELRDIAQAAAERLDQLIVNLCQQITANVSACPEHMRVQQVEVKAKSTRHKPKKKSDYEDLATLEPAAMLFLKHTAPVIDEETAQTEVQDEQSAADPPFENVHGLVEDVVPAAAEVPPPAPPVLVTVTYDWVCRWTPQMRLLLSQIDDAVAEWVSKENAYREKFTVFDMKHLTMDEIDLFELSDQLMLVDMYVVACFPPACLHGDDEALRKQRQMEKGRLARLNLKEKKKAELLATAQSAAVGENASPKPPSPMKLIPAPSSPSKRKLSNGSSFAASSSPVKLAEDVAPPTALPPQSPLPLALPPNDLTPVRSPERFSLFDTVVSDGSRLKFHKEKTLEVFNGKKFQTPEKKKLELPPLESETFDSGKCIVEEIPVEITSSWIKGRKPFAIVIHNVLTEEECKAWIDCSERLGYEAALVNVGGGLQRKMTDVRNSSRCIIDSEASAAQLWGRIRTFVPEDLYDDVGPLELNERLRFLKYYEGEYFAPHFDGRYDRPFDHPSRGDKSFITYQLYLNEGFEGGSTRFFADNDNYFDVVPKTGSVLLFEHRMLHSGETLTKGCKYAVRTDIMYRQRGVVKEKERQSILTTNL